MSEERFFLMGTDGSGKPMGVPADDVILVAAFSSGNSPDLATVIRAFDRVGNETKFYSSTLPDDVSQSLQDAGVPMISVEFNGTQQSVNATRIGFISPHGSGTTLRLVTAAGKNVVNASANSDPTDIAIAVMRALRTSGIDERFVETGQAGSPASILPVSAILAVTEAPASRRGSDKILADATTGTSDLYARDGITPLVTALVQCDVPCAQFTGTAGERIFVVADMVRSVSEQQGQTILRLSSDAGRNANLSVTETPPDVVARLESAMQGVRPQIPQPRSLDLV